MIRPAAVVLIVLCALAQAHLDRRVVVAEFDDSVRFLGYELQLQFKLELVRAERQEVEVAAGPLDLFVRDTLVAP
jgi:hypothetical protein